MPETAYLQGSLRQSQTCHLRHHCIKYHCSPTMSLSKVSGRFKHFQRKTKRGQYVQVAHKQRGKHLTIVFLINDDQRESTLRGTGNNSCRQLLPTHAQGSYNAETPKRWPALYRGALVTHQFQGRHTRAHLQGAPTSKEPQSPSKAEQPSRKHHHQRRQMSIFHGWQMI